VHTLGLDVLEAWVLAAGKDFAYNEALKPGGLVNAVAVSLATVLGGAAVLIPPLRFLIRKIVPKPGEGDVNLLRVNCWIYTVYHLAYPIMCQKSVVK